MSHVLLVEDDPAVLHLLQATADYGGFTSSQAVSAAETLRRVRSEPFDAILLDLGLPDLAGSHLIEEIRALSDIPVIVVSGRSDEPTRIAALDAGADDFVSKPFMPGELLARVRAAMRRYTTVPGEQPDAPGELAEERPSSFTTHRTIKRGSMEDRLIGFLRAREGELVTSDDIIASVWGPDKQRTEKNVRVLVAMVRRKLKAQGQPFEIINEHGRGYRIVRSERGRRPLAR